MSDTTGEPDETKPSLVSLDTLSAVDLEAPIRELQVGEARVLAQGYFTAARLAKAANPSSAEAAVYQLLADICFIQLGPEADGSPWRSASSFGRRLPLPEDYRGEQAAILSGVVRAVEHPVLRARLADLIWTVDRKAYSWAASVAISAYATCVAALLTGDLKPEFPCDGLQFRLATEPAGRALQIAYMTSKKGAIPDDVRHMLMDLYNRTADAGAFVAFERTAKLAHEYEILQPADIAPKLEAVADQTAPFPLASKGLWDFAAHLYERVGDREARRRCQLKAVDQLLAMRSQVSSAGAEASWIMDALQALRHVANVDELEDQLNAELRRLQKSSLKEMGTFSVPVDVNDEMKEVHRVFCELDLPDSLREFALLARSRPVDDLRASALKLAEESPLMSTIGMVLVDEDGRTAKRVDGIRVEEPPEDNRLLHLIDRLESYRRHSVVAGLIEPARRVMNARHHIRERHLLPIVARTPFVPDSQTYILALGFTAFLNGDFISAVHTVLPQLEPCLRNILTIVGEDPAKRRDDGTEEDLALSRLFARFRDRLETIFGCDLTAEIERLFDLRPGPALRHELAHGQMSAGDCYHPNAVYAVWLMYRLCCIFVISDWPSIIRPAIEAA